MDTIARIADSQPDLFWWVFAAAHALLALGIIAHVMWVLFFKPLNEEDEA